MSRPLLRSPRISIWPQCRTVLTGGMHGFLIQPNLPKPIFFVVSERAPVLILSVLFGIYQSLAPLLWLELVGQRWRPLFGLFAWNLICDVSIG